MKGRTGLLAAAGLTRILRASLFGVSPLGSATFTLVPVVLAGIAALACYVPAQRATKVDPVETLHKAGGGGYRITIDDFRLAICDSEVVGEGMDRRVALIIEAREWLVICG